MKALNKYYLSTKQKIGEWSEDASGFGTVEMVIMMFVLIGLVLIFKSEVTSLITNYFQKMDPGLSYPTP